MRILLTNDDGIHAPGLVALEKIARQLSDDIFVVAPETDQSGVSHSLSLSDPLRLRQVDDRRFAIRGTPTDCVIMGVRNIMTDKAPDLVLSGVNRGQNIAEDITYSGTIAAAMEGTLLGVPSIALSQAHGFGGGGEAISFACAEAHAVGVIRKLLAHGFSKNMLFNVNFPDCAPDAVKGVSTTIQGQRNQAQMINVVERDDFRGSKYFWLTFARERPTPVTGTDLWAMFEKRISVTPLKLDLTDVAALERLSEVFDGVK